MCQVSSCCYFVHQFTGSISSYHQTGVHYGYLSPIVMNVRSAVSAGITVALVLSVFPITAEAASGPNPNAWKMGTENFRRAKGDIVRYKFNKRSIERRGTDGFTNAGEGQTTEDRRDEYLREAQRMRIQEDVERRKHTGETRSKEQFSAKQRRSESLARRRIRNAEEWNGIRLRQGRQFMHTMDAETAQEKLEKREAHRLRIKDEQERRYQFQKTDCSKLRGRRGAQCWYKWRND